MRSGTAYAVWSGTKKPAPDYIIPNRRPADHQWFFCAAIIGRQNKSRAKPLECPVRVLGYSAPGEPQDSPGALPRTPGCSRSLQLGLDANGFIHVWAVGYNAANTSPFSGNSLFNLMALPERFSVVADSELVRGSTLYCDRRSTPRASDWGHGDLRHLRCVTKR